jgi:hypothetical protein
MAISETAYLKMMGERSLCPQCYRTLVAGQQVGSGKKSDGVFCSLKCFSSYHALDLIERARLIQRKLHPPQ